MGGWGGERKREGEERGRERVWRIKGVHKERGKTNHDSTSTSTGIHVHVLMNSAQIHFYGERGPGYIMRCPNGKNTNTDIENGVLLYEVPSFQWVIVHPSPSSVQCGYYDVTQLLDTRINSLVSDGVQPWHPLATPFLLHG